MKTPVTLTTTLLLLLLAAATTLTVSHALPSSSSSSSSSPVERRQATPAPLNDLLKKKGKLYFGTAQDLYATAGESTDTAYQSYLNDSTLFGQVTPANAMKYAYTEPTQNVFDYAPGQAVIDGAQAHGQLVRCHNLIWHQQLPAWLTGRTWTPADNATMQSIMKNHISSLITHYGDACYAWDVVNEPLTDSGATLNASPFAQAIGPAYFPLAFQFAADAVAAVVAQGGKDIRLYVNEYNDEAAGAKTSALQALVQDVQNRGIRIDGVGFESHFVVGSTPSRAAQTAAKQAFADMGLDVAVTELDVRFASLPPSAQALAQQAADYVSSVGSCLDVDRCVGVTVWDFDDEYSWIPSTFAGQGAADLFDASLSPKPAVVAIQSLLE